MHRGRSFQQHWLATVFSGDGPDSPISRLVLAALGQHMNADGSRCFPSTRTLAIETGLSERSVCTHLEHAATAGWIEVRQRAGSGQSWRSNLYLPRFPGAERGSVRFAGKGAEHGSVRGTERGSVHSGAKVLNLEQEGAESDDRKVLNDVQPTRPVTRKKTRERRNRASRSASPKGTRFALETLPQDWHEFARKERPDVEPDREFQIFADYWRAQPGQKGIKVDWLATWRNWIRRARPAHPSPAAPRGEHREDQMPRDVGDLVRWARARNLPDASPGESTDQYRARLRAQMSRTETT